MVVEICCSSLESVRNARMAGAHRVELCVDLRADGLTPPDAFTEAACSEGLPVHVLVRPRPGHFVFSATEWDLMAEDIRRIRQFPIAGVVIGGLDEARNIPINPIRRLMKEAEGLSLTFHRAFDLVADPLLSIEVLLDLGFDRVLTSGACATALEGLPLLKQLQNRAGDDLIVLPGGGITEAHATVFADVGFSEIHLSARNRLAPPGSEPIADLETIQRVVSAFTSR